MEWLNENPMNVIVVHCRSGKGRTGTLVSILLLRLGMANNVGEAVGYFTSCRTKSTYVRLSPYWFRTSLPSV